MVEWGSIPCEQTHQAAATALAIAVVSAPAAHHAVHGQHRPATAAAAGARGRVAGAAVKGLPQV